MAMKVCYVKGCFNTSYNTKKNFFSLPRGKSDKIRRKNWIDFAQDGKLLPYINNFHRASGYVCQDHFCEKDFKDPWTRTRLLLHAVPTIPPLNPNIFVPRAITVEESTLTKEPEELEFVNCPSDYHDDVYSHDDRNEIETTTSNNHFVDSVIFDHTYHNVILPVLQNFCRICGKRMEDSKVLVPIFNHRGVLLNIAKKISTHLNIRVRENDGLPQQICSLCMCHLNICQELVQVSQDAEAKLCQIFQVTIDKSREDRLEIFNKTETESTKENSCRPIDRENPFEIDYHKDDMDTQLESEYNNLTEDLENCMVENIILDVNPIDFQLSEKISKNDKPESYLCEKCGQIVISKENVIKHKRTCSKKVYLCIQCKKPFRSKFRLSEHTNVHNNVRPYSCLDCDEAFYRRIQLQRHLETHKPDYIKKIVVIPPCKICGKTFKALRTLKVHSRRHSEEWCFKCRQCGEKFSKKKLLYAHKQQVHQQDINRFEAQNLMNDKGQLELLCHVCGQNFDDIKKFQRHKRIHLPEHLKKKHHCTVCPKSFGYKSRLQEHMNMHNGLRLFGCNICDKRFYRQIHLYHHKLKHVLIPCEICGKEYRGRLNLQQHMKWHKKKRLYKCRQCEQEFDFWDEFLSHRKMHAEQKKRMKEEQKLVKGVLFCEFCDRMLSNKGVLTKHLRTVHGIQKDAEYKWKCKQCNCLFATKATLALHTHSDHSSDNSALSVEDLLSNASCSNQINVKDLQIVIDDYDFQ